MAKNLRKAGGLNSGEVLGEKKELEIYIHIPFCVKKCAYCDFLSAPAKASTRERYVEALKQEIRESRSLRESYEVSTVFVGGGTPSLLEDRQLAGILGELRNCFFIRDQAEITVECNPGTLTGEKLKSLWDYGVNRLSLGLQSAQKEELALLGRIHTWEEFLESFCLAREAGFSNINVDLMSGLPGQTRRSWQDTLEQVVALKPEHISAYSLILEEGTPLYEQYGKTAEERTEKNTGGVCEIPPLPHEDTERQMYYDTREILETAGFSRYEISNYARPGRECQHNLGYWRRVEYKGFGVGAASLLDGCRFRNQEALEPYLQRQFAVTDYERLTPGDVLSETMFLGLRTREGVRITEQIHKVYQKELERYERQGFLVEQEGFLRLTDRGIDVSNWILADFLR
ncbi:MAG: radical SAM family heme chaperone HemW [Lachnospiraceae bacterium]|nr:radical SAM family heme chaperone HemW [Lachnospiraceae bacterium]